MLEPRGGLRSTILRGDSVTIEAEASLVESSSAAGAAAVVQYEHHDTPSLPMHPALEYEVLAEKMAVMVCPTEEQHLSDADQVTAEPIVRNSENQVKLLVAFLFLIASGVGTVVSTKLQAIPM